MPTANPYLKTYTNADGEQLAALHNFHSGLAAFIGYELPCGLQINASYQIAFSDMFAFEHAATTFLLPQKVSLGLGYRFNRKQDMGLKTFFKRAFSDMKADMKVQHELDKANFNAVKAESKAQWKEAKRTPEQMREARNAERQAKIAEARQREAEANDRLK